MEELILKNEGGGIRVDVAYPLDFDGKAHLSIHVAVVNPTML